MKKIFVFSILVTSLLFAASSFAKQDFWEIDKSHSTIGFTVKHLGLSKVRGHFDNYDAKVKADINTGKLSWVKASANVDSIKTGIEKRDLHLQAEDFFNAKKHPKIVLETQSIKWNGKKISGNAKLTMKGKTKVVPYTGEQTGVVTAKLRGKKSIRTGYEISATINRQDFNMKFNAIAEGVNVVSDEVTLNFEVQLYRIIE